MFEYNRSTPLVKFNGIPLAAYHAKLETKYEITAPTVTSTAFKADSRSTFNILNQSVGMLSLKFPIDFWANGKVATQKCVSDFNAAVCGDVEIDIGDGFVYHAVCSDMGTASWINDEWCTCDYTFSGIRCGEEITLEAATEIYNPGNYPRTDCTLEIDGSAIADETELYIQIVHGSNIETNTDRQSFGFSGYTLSTSVYIDGVGKEISEIGESISGEVHVSIAKYCTWTDFPYLTPGENHLTVEKADGTELESGYRLTFTPAYL